ncbi:MAG TPA: GNAT family N-acetyltransferase [Burkholderiales bacterium]
MKRPPLDGARVLVERSKAGKVSRELWRGLVRFNRQQAGPLAYSRKVISARARGGGLGATLLAAAEREARRRGSRLIHLNTYSFQAPRFYEKQGYRRFGAMSGSPRHESRYFYVKHLRPA